MSNKHVYVVPTPINNCQVCGKKEELRPYGKNGAWVCFECGMKDEEEAKRQFNKQFLSKKGMVVLGMPATEEPDVKPQPLSAIS